MADVTVIFINFFLVGIFPKHASVVSNWEVGRDDRNVAATTCCGGIRLFPVQNGYRVGDFISMHKSHTLRLARIT